MSSKTILATCYAVNPYKGSEDGMGWNFVFQIARFNKVIAITRKNNRASIEKFMAENPNEIYNNITFYYFDLPYWMRFWKKGGRGALVYYYMWQRGIVSFIKNLDLHFDIVHNVNFHNDWTPSFLYKLKKPMVWGPIGHHPLIPNQYLKPYPITYLIIDRATWLVKKIFWNFSFSLKKTMKNADYILCMNTGVPSVLELKNQTFSIQPSVATEDYFEGEITHKVGFKVISVGRFVPLKGFDLALNSFIQFLYSLRIPERENCRLTLVGTGPEKKFYQKIIAEKNAEKYIEIVEWMDRKELMKLYETASVFLFPSHEGAGMVVPEALSFGLPVICLNNEGPGEFLTTDCGFAVPQLDYNSTVSALKESLQKLYFDKDLLYTMSLSARKQFEERFTWDSRGAFLKNIYKKL